MRKNDYIKTMRAMHMPDDMRARIAQRMAQENEHKGVSISMFKHKKKRILLLTVIAATVVVGGSAFAFGGTAISQIIATCSASGGLTPACRVRSSVSGMPVLQRRLRYRALIMALHSKTA